ncbi:DUF4832 domain-containing protein [Paenibacillus turpanensis]|uniref:DUF4832 domain-containing protein n=1 Tax=Paenibacillus turpanensis TaxID=2689078 RepID=UPI00140C0477|nr:DUF4832 domain-containing protein [Paenibacillus turpanensis]
MRKKIGAIALFIVLCIAGFSLHEVLLADQMGKRVHYYPAETDEVLNNPYMGFSVDAKEKNAASQPFRLAHANVTWRLLEPEKGEYDFAQFEEMINLQYWKERDVSIVLRLLLDYPRDYSHMDIPDWLYEEIGESGTWYELEYGKGFSPDYAHPLLIQYHERLVKALGERYNNNPQIAFIQLGSIGHWGEWHTWDEDDGNKIKFPDEEITDQYALHYVRYLNNKFLLMRRPHEVALNHNMGLFNDAFGKTESTIEGFLDWYTNGYTSWLTGEEEPAMPDFWVRSPSAGEFSHETKYVEDANIEETIRQAKLTHVSWMGPYAPSREKAGSRLQHNIDRFLKTVGYRFVVAKESHEPSIKAGQTLHIEMKLVNRGVAPFYFAWPLELSLVDSTGRIAAAGLGKTDVRKWLPGENTAKETLQIPHDLVPGVYTVHVAILDPETGKPGIRFATAGGRKDLRYPLGQVTVK